MATRDRVRLLALIILGGLVAALIFHGVMRFGLQTGYPQNTFLFRADDRFNDFYNPLRGSFDLDPYNPDRIGYIGGYLPFGYFITYLFSLVQPPERSLLLFLGGILALSWRLRRLEPGRLARPAPAEGPPVHSRIRSLHSLLDIPNHLHCGSGKFRCRRVHLRSALRSVLPARPRRACSRGPRSCDRYERISRHPSHPSSFGSPLQGTGTRLASWLDS